MHLPKPNEGGSFTPPPAGTFPAICYRIVDLGTQQSSYQGKLKRAHKILISWEIKDEDAVTEDGKPMSMHQQFTWSMHEKAALRKTLESWRGKAFTEADFGPTGFDIRNLLGVPCFMGIVHTDRDGATYANISAISKLPKDYAVAPLANEKTYLWLDKDGFQTETFAKLSEKLQDKIKASPEYQSLVNGKPERIVDADSSGAPFYSDEIPFAPSWK